ncbi:MAG: hypothetical protein KC609_00910, partial [Myxococcales bacterium]|nr:hypothetical protein [Myxococcales bacterium]
TWQHEDDAGTPTNNTNLDESLKAIFTPQGFVYLNSLRGILKLGGTTWLAGLFFSEMSGSYRQLVKCDTTGCVTSEITSLPNTGDESWWTVALHGVLDATDELLWIVNYDDNGIVWHFNSYNGTSWSDDCDGSVASNACFSTVGIFDGPTDSVGFRDIHGTKDTRWVVGEPIALRFVGDYPFSQTADCTVENESLVCANGSSCVADTCTAANTIGRLLRGDSTGWTEIPPIPLAQRLTEPSGVKVDLYEYVYEHVRSLQNGNVVMVQGYYRACIDSTDDSTDDCFTTAATVTLKRRPFVVFYYPGSQTWSKMYPLSDGVERKCCNGYDGDCPTTDSATPTTCGSQEHNRSWLYSVSGLGVRTVSGSTQLYLLENRPRAQTCTTDTDCPSADWYCSGGYCESNLLDFSIPVYHYFLSSPPSL